MSSIKAVSQVFPLANMLPHLFPVTMSLRIFPTVCCIVKVTLCPGCFSGRLAVFLSTSHILSLFHVAVVYFLTKYKRVQGQKAVNKPANSTVPRTGLEGSWNRWHNNFSTRDWAVTTCTKDVKPVADMLVIW